MMAESQIAWKRPAASLDAEPPRQAPQVIYAWSAQVCTIAPMGGAVGDAPS